MLREISVVGLWMEPQLRGYLALSHCNGHVDVNSGNCPLSGLPGLYRAKSHASHLLGFAAPQLVSV
jgi:hypothetical protein